MITPTVYIYTIKLDSTSFLIFIAVFYQAWGPRLNPIAFGGSHRENSYSVLDATLPLHTPSSPHSCSSSIHWGHSQPSDTAPYTPISPNAATAAWSLLAEVLRDSRHPPILIQFTLPFSLSFILFAFSSSKPSK